MKQNFYHLQIITGQSGINDGVLYVSVKATSHIVGQGTIQFYNKLPDDAMHTLIAVYPVSRTIISSIEYNTQ